ncbi:unnamed protein product [Zymoseptoria tritici ST99CH_1A5]|uniref:Non-structural maintenance of chromosomes element 4 n=3 Tax=Zymoseptoria tritici TaxID=1047171 RepID=A0A1X7RQC1_ZYMT9|nr:unnamed protein product [Zymoseptoria tritici ST99CH_3D7]SMR50179.1 unnamed protein product [Zymoseptoria tritici ST99CH_3D1]SMY22880.1 unnamed protein product [Zymoseptoria tritici ST99CH_1A5]
MARLNTRPSTVAGSRLNSVAPPSSNGSNEENHDPEQEKRRAPPRTSLPTPGSDSSGAGLGQKRKRGNTQPMPTQATDAGDDDDGDTDKESKRFNRYYDPNQDKDQRRQVKRKSRKLERDFAENRDELLRGDANGLTETINRANQVFKNVKQTGDAVLDSKLMVNVTELAFKKTAQLVLGDASTGVDVTEFLSKCITYMQKGGYINGDEDEAPARTQRTQSTQRRRTRERDEDDDEDGDFAEPLDWAVLGKHACFPYNTRPACPSFLLGPLSVEKKVRAMTQRRARNTKDTNSREARPEALTREDLGQADENALTKVCDRIHTHLKQHIASAALARDRAMSRGGMQDQEAQEEFLKKHKISDEGGPFLFEYAVNPQSFGQTVENLFYISFLIKEGYVGIKEDSKGFPSLILHNKQDPNVEQPARKKDSTKHQAVFAIDFQTWEDLIAAFNLKKPMIPHREEDPATQIGSRGWYA